MEKQNSLFDMDTKIRILETYKFEQLTTSLTKQNKSLINITITLILRALLSFEARVFSFAARRVIYARGEAEGINDTEGCK